MAMTVEPMMATPKAGPLDPSLSRWPTTPTPAGTNSNDKCASMAVVVGAMVCASLGQIKQITNSAAMPITGPGNGKPKLREVTSPNN